jgi:hypothetical protein
MRKMLREGGAISIFVFLEQVFTVQMWKLNVLEIEIACNEIPRSNYKGGLKFAEWSGLALRARQEATWTWIISVNGSLCILPLHGKLGLALICI